MIGFLPGANVSWQALVGGLVVGALVAFIFTRTRSPQRSGIQIGLLTAVTVGLLRLLLIPTVFWF